MSLNKSNTFDHLDLCPVRANCWLAAVILCAVPSARAVPTNLEVSSNRRFLIHKDTRKPFLFISDTAGSLVKECMHEQAIEYLDIRKQQGFTMIQFIATGHYRSANKYGDLPFHGDFDFARPNTTPGSDFADAEQYDYWDHMEWILTEIFKRQMYASVLPTWRQEIHDHRITKDNAQTYGEFLGSRFRHLNDRIIWLMGGDRPVTNKDERLLYQRLAKGIAIGVAGREDYEWVMMSYHISGPGRTDSQWPEDEPWMDFNTTQSGHGIDNSDGLLETTYRRQLKPVLDFEPYYDKNAGTTDLVRTIIHWGVFAGGFGTSYGHWSVWHFADGKFKYGKNDYEYNPPDCYNGPSAGYANQIKHLAQLLQSRPFLTRIPDQSVVTSNTYKGRDRIRATRSCDGSYLMVFSPRGWKFDVDLGKLSADLLRWWWFNPRTGGIHSKGTMGNHRHSQTFTPPTNGERFSGHDWILVLDDASKNFPAPGTPIDQESD